MEKFITTSVMEGDDRIGDEWTFGLYATEAKRAAQRDYWANYYQEEDFRRMREAGLTHTRIPLGYWHLCSQAELDSYQEACNSCLSLAKLRCSHTPPAGGRSALCPHWHG